MSTRKVVGVNPTQKIPRSRTACTLPTGIEKRLAAYAIAAAAGLVASSQPASAATIFTPANTSISWGVPVLLDLDGGVDDFNINYNGSGGSAYLSINGIGANSGVLGTVWLAQLLSTSNTVGIGGDFQRSRRLLGLGYYSSTSFYTSGYFQNVTNAYVGLVFDIGGSTHYGWARFNVSHTQPTTITATLTGYAYESTPGAPIHVGSVSSVPEPGSLGLMALGIVGLAAWRRKKTQKIS